MNLLPAGTVNEVLAGGGVDKGAVHEFIRACHKVEQDASGMSYAAIGILPTGAVWVLAGGDRDELLAALREAQAEAAEVLELRTLN